MSERNFKAYLAICCFVFAAGMLLFSCSTTKHLSADQTLLRKNTVVLTSNKIIYNKGEIKDNLYHLALQKPNSYSYGMPFKLWRYNMRYKKLHARPDSALTKMVERPVVFDTSMISFSTQNMRSYMFNQGYFYAKVKDTVIFRKKKAYVTYKVNAGENYLINKVSYQADDSLIARLINESTENTALITNKEFNFSMVDEERSRLTALARNNGYYRFSQENVAFVLDTVDKAFFRDVENPFENAINYISFAKSNKKPTTDVNVVVKTKEDHDNVQHRIASVTVYTDRKSTLNLKDLPQNEKMLNGILFKFNDEYVHSKVIADRIYIAPGALFSQANYDKTIVKLNELGIFQYVRIVMTENSDSSSNTLDCAIFLNRAKKYDLSSNMELSSGTTYALGNSAGVSLRNKNLGKGADLLSMGINGGVELSYSEGMGKDISQHFGVLNEYYGFNTSLDMPKFLSPIGAGAFGNSNLPHTIISAGSNVINRVEYFTLISTSASFKYNWKQTPQITWEFSPAFINIIRLPRETQTFKDRLDSNEFLRNSYRQTFIEGENITFVYTDVEKKRGKNYSYLKLGFEEAGGVLQALNSVGYALNDLYKIKFAQYAKLDFDARHFFDFKHSVLVTRFYGGIGLPYGQLSTLPYIKQYYVGGPYSLRGWHIRNLGPGSYYNSATNGNNTIDLTGDIKLEMNAEYRFPILPLFAGAIKMNGAFFADAGNIWLARADSTYKGGEFSFSTLGQDIAMDIGAGARFDIASFFTFRLDVAVPVKKPYEPSNDGWVFDKLDPAQSGWRKDNVVVQLSIGYPF